MATSRLDPVCPECGGTVDRCGSDWHLPAPPEERRPGIAGTVRRFLLWLLPSIIVGSLVGILIVVLASIAL